jgi:hypothetical protein
MGTESNNTARCWNGDYDTLSAWESCPFSGQRAGAGTQFTCCTSTNVQILTPDRGQGAHAGRAGVRMLTYADLCGRKLTYADVS